MLLLEYDTIKKARVDKTTTQLEFETEVRDNSGEYKIKGIWGSVVYIRESDDHLPDFYYLLLWKSYSEKEKT